MDFFIGSSPEECVFAKVDISKDDQAKPGWKIKARNITVTVYDGENNGINGTHVEIMGQKTGLSWGGSSGTDGEFTVENVPPGFYTVTIQTGGFPLKIYFATDYPNLDYPIVVVANLKSWLPDDVEVNIHVDHYINPNSKDVDIYLGFNTEGEESIGHTDEHSPHPL